MKKYVILLVILFSCDKPVEKKTGTVQEQKPAATAQTPAIPAEETAMQKWQQFYQNQDQTFQPEKFTAQPKSKINYREDESPILPDQDFNMLYQPFLVFSPDRSKYIDIDSYHWQLYDGNASFEADQKAVLVDMNSKTSQQIAFFGPSFRIEEAYWKNDHQAVLLGNTYEKVPFFIEYDFRENTQQFFQYPDTLKFEKTYGDFRLESKGIGTK